MQELSGQQLNLVSGGRWVFVTPEWKHSEAQITGTIFGVLGASFGALALCAEVSAITLSVPVVLGLAAYGAGYGLSRLENCFLENYTWYDISPPPVIIFI